MYTEDELASAVAAGVLSEEAASRFRQYVATLRRTAAVDEEQVRLLTGFNDVFVVIASGLLLGAVYWMGLGIAAWAGPLLMGLIAWGLAEFFTRRRRMALPSVALLLAFTAGASGAVFAVQGWTPLVAGVAAVACWIHWTRFRVPITIAVGVGSAVACLVSTLTVITPAASNWVSAMVLLAGLATFGLAMSWDSLDKQRVTSRSDVAFWLHLLAAPMVVHPIFSEIGLFDSEQSTSTAVVVIGIYIAISVVSLAVDRRALMVSSLAYVGYAFIIILQQYGTVSLAFAATALTLGSALLLLSAFWNVCRAGALRLFPTRIRTYLPGLH
jgi:hypothetical protein